MHTHHGPAALYVGCASVGMCMHCQKESRQEQMKADVLMWPGGSAKQARDRSFQAVLPLRGKILNVERKDDAALYKNNEISNLIVALGLGLKGEEMLNLRYGKV